MHSIYQRINALSASLTTACFILIALISATTFILQPAAETLAPATSLSIEHKSLVTRRLGWYNKQYQVADLNFNLTADLSPLFHWNTKQLFVYITADYEHSAKGIQNSVVIWDRIVRSPEDAQLELVRQRPKYPLRDYSKSFKQAKPATYTLHYDVMPYMGVLTSGAAGSSKGAIPFKTS